MRLLAVIIIGVLLLDLFCSSEAWWISRRRSSRRRYNPPPVPPPCRPPSTAKYKWANMWDKEFTFQCPSGQSITEFHSLYSTCHGDRVFRFACRKNKGAKGLCHWSHYVNDFDKLVNFKCPYIGFITGISSYHDDHYEDRRFKFRCCMHFRFLRYHCTTGSHFLGEWKKPLHFKAPRDVFLVGATSEHDNGKNDRRWKFETCKVRPTKFKGWNRKVKKN